ncbi:hypothetical protein ACROYT_G038423 [Oculina patagonica]
MVLHVTLLAEEWTQSAKGGTHSILNRQLAIHLAQLPNVKVGLLIPKCSPEDKQDAEQYQINIVEPEECPGLDPVYLLGHPPEGFSTDFIIGHDIKLGWQGKVIRQKCGCKWIHVVHSNTEEMGLYKNFAGAISAGQEEHETQVKLCESADMVVTIGPKLKDSFSSSLSMLGKEVVNLTPGIFDEFCNIRHKFQDTKTCKILIFGTGDAEDFELKGLDVAAKAVAALDDPKYRLMVVGAPDGRQEELANKLCSHGISREQLIVRRFYKDRKQLAHFFCEVDLLLMPSGTEAFGIAALEALSEGVPLLLTSNSGLADALREVPLGPQCIVDPNANWAKEIKKAWNNLKTRQEEAKILCERYKEKYSWKEQCAALVEKMQSMHDPVPQQSVVKSLQLQSNAAEQEATNSRQKRKVLCSSYVTEGNVKKAKGESTQLTSEPVPDSGRGLLQSNSPGSVAPTINQTTIDVNADKGETQSTENEDWKLLHSAVEGGNVAIIETVLARGLDVNSKDSAGDTPLMIAALFGKIEAVNYLLDKGADLSLTAQYGRNSLHAASFGGNVAIIETMLSRGLDVNSKDSDGDTPLMIAAWNGKIKAVNYLLDKGADLSLTGQFGRNLLHRAAQGGNVAIIETMLSRGLDVNSKDNNSDTPIMIAAFCGKMEAVNYLLDKGADLSLTSISGRNLLHRAAQGGNVAIIETMLSRGLNVNSKDNNGDTPLKIAAAQGNAEAVNYLLSREAR